LQVVPWGFRKLLNWIAEEYNNPPVLITENGFPDHGDLNDRDRIDYLIVSGSISLFPL
jgi:beta-glucosidase/6-phospho-beta-glucosidase/beta-galactosidase